VMEDWQYASDEVQLTKGDVIFLYTDGVTEAENKERRMYSMDKLADFLNSEAAGKARSMQELLGCVWADLGKFVGDAEQSDDITMLAITYGDAKKKLNFFHDSPHNF